MPESSPSLFTALPRSTSRSLSYAALRMMTGLVLCTGSTLATAQPQQPLFTETSTRLYSVGGNTVPYASDSGDLNNDGFLDIVTVQADAVAIQLGQGDGTFVAGTHLLEPAAQVNQDVALGDLDRNGNLDLVIAKGRFGHVEIFPGNGDGTFQESVTWAFSNADAVAFGTVKLADMDGDGILDVITGDLNNGVVVRRGNGSGGFYNERALVSFSLGGGVSVDSVALVDADGDNELDILFSSRRVRGVQADLFQITDIRRGGTVRAFNYGLGAFTRLAAASRPGGGMVFVLAEGPGQSGRLLVGSDPANPSSIRMITTAQAGWSMPYLADFDNDGLPDLLLGEYATSPGRVFYLSDAGASTGLPQPIQPSYAFINVGSPADINNDGRLDLLLGSYSSNSYSVFLQKPPLIFTSPAETTFEEGTPGSFTTVVSGADAPAFSLFGALPAGLSYSAGGVMSGTPAPGTAGQYRLFLTVTDNVRPPVSQPYLLTVVPRLVPRVDSPEVQNLASQSVSLGGWVVADNGFPVTRRGLVLAPTALNPAPRLGGPNVTVVEAPMAGTGTFMLPVGGLSGGTSYSFAVFGENARGAGYSAVVSFFTPPEPGSGSLVVTTPADENDGTSYPSVGAGTSLREAIFYARTLGGDRTITFLPSLFQSGPATLTLTLGELTVTGFSGTLAISGPGASRLTVSGGNSSRIFRVSDAGLRLDGLTLTAGRAPDGGAILNSGTLTVNACVFSGNRTSTLGGAIYQTGGTTVISRSSFLGNGAVNPVGNPFTGMGGAIANGGGPVWVINSTFHDNSAVNNSTGAGGALSTFHGTAITRVIHSTITGNSADGDSGGIQLLSGSVELQNSIVSGNTAPINANVSDNFTVAGMGNIVGGNAAALFTTSTPVTSGGETPFFPLSPSGAAINAGINALSVDASMAALTTDQAGNPRLAGGTVDAGAGEYLTAPSISSPTVTGVGSTRAVLGGNVTSDGGTLSQRGILIARTTDTPSPVLGGNGVRMVTVPGGAGVFSTEVADLLPLTSYSFVAFASKALGTAYSSVATFTTTESPGLFVTRADDVADAYDGTISLREAVVHANSLGGAQTISFAASLQGQTIILSAPAVGPDHPWTTSALTVTGNLTIQGPAVAPGITLAVSSTVQRRHLLVETGGSLTLSRLTFTGGNVQQPGFSYGGAVWSFGSLTVRDCTFTGNTAASEGGAIQAWGNSSLLTVENSTFSGNTSPGGSAINGGALSMSLRHLTLTGNQGNHVLSFWTNPATLTHCIVAGNTADGIALVNGAVLTGASTYNLLGTGDTGGLTNGVNGNLTGITSPLLGALDYYGGPAKTHVLLPGSPALDAGDPAFNSAALGSDQRGTGHPRVEKGLATSAAPRVDIGAYELFAAPVVATHSLTVTSDSPAIDLDSAAGVSPAGGTFSGPGVSDRQFSPAGLPLGLHTITYTVSDNYGSTNLATLTVTVTEAPSLVVTTMGDDSTTLDGQTSLREAVAYANSLGGARTITFAPPLHGQTLTLSAPAIGPDHPWTTSTLTVTGNITIEGPAGAPGITLAVSSAVQRRHLLVETGGSLTLSRLTFTGGNVQQPGFAYGGAVWSLGSLTVRDCTFTGNSAAAEGGAIQAWGHSPLMVVENSTFTGNSSPIGSAINGGAQSMTLRHLTITANTGHQTLSFWTHAATLTHCIVSGNTPDSIALVNGATLTGACTYNLLGTGDTGGLINGVNGNLTGITEPGLAALADNGGPTPTMALLSGSPAIDAGVPASLNADQRGQPRASSPDIGAFENQLAAIPLWRWTHNLPADGSQDTATPAGDGVSNLLKYAFNLAPRPGELTRPNVLTLPAQGTAGLPRITADSQGRLVIDFIRRKATTSPGISYEVLTGDNFPEMSLLPLTGATITSLDPVWERVTITDPAQSPRRFGTVRVNITP